MANQKMGVKVKKLAGIILGAAIGLSGCGGTGTNNDQGTSFLAFGYFTDATGATGLTGQAFSLLEGSQASSGLGVVAYMGIQNLLSSQFVRVTQITCGYDVPGSNVSLYQDSFNSSFVIGPNSTTTVGTLKSAAYVGFQMVNRSVISYFANRINELPQLPTPMNVECIATGISQAGDVYQTNPLGFQVTLTDDPVVADPVTDPTAPGTLDGALLDPTLTDTTTDTTTDTDTTGSDTSAL